MLEHKILLRFTGEDKSGSAAFEVPVSTLIVAGWTGSDREALEAHILELEELGVKRPRSTPVFYRMAATLLTQGPEIEVVGAASSGEVEPVIVSAEDGLWLGIASDHTDREVEAIGVTISKQLCAKPVSKTLWRLDSVADHWDELTIRSWVIRNNERTLYQEGKLAKMRHPKELISLYGKESALPAGTVMLCGTVAVKGKIAPAEQFEMEIEDPILKRTITHRYRTVELPIND